VKPRPVAAAAQSRVCLKRLSPRTLGRYVRPRPVAAAAAAATAIAAADAAAAAATAATTPPRRLQQPAPATATLRRSRRLQLLASRHPKPPPLSVWRQFRYKPKSSKTPTTTTSPTIWPVLKYKSRGVNVPKRPVSPTIATIPLAATRRKLQDSTTTTSPTIWPVLKYKSRGVNVPKRPVSPTIAAIPLTATHRKLRGSTTTSSGVSSMRSSPDGRDDKEETKSNVVGRRLSFADASPGPSRPAAAAAASQDSFTLDDVPEPPKRRLPRVLLEEVRPRFNDNHDVAIINEALRSRALGDVDVWRRFRINNLNLFFQFRVDSIREQAILLAKGICRRKFREDHALALNAMRDLLLRELDE